MSATLAVRLARKSGATAAARRYDLVSRAPLSSGRRYLATAVETPGNTSSLSSSPLSSSSSASSLFPSPAYSAPSIATSSIPGPASQSLSQSIGAFQDPRTHTLVVDYEKVLEHRGRKRSRYAPRSGKQC